VKKNPVTITVNNQLKARKSTITTKKEKKTMKINKTVRAKNLQTINRKSSPKMVKIIDIKVKKIKIQKNLKTIRMTSNLKLLKIETKIKKINKNTTIKMAKILETNQFLKIKTPKLTLTMDQAESS
jgi:hypothetical protein